MKSKEWARLILVMLASNGWWVVGCWPRLGLSSSSEAAVGPVVMVPLFASVMLVVWVWVALAESWGD